MRSRAALADEDEDDVGERRREDEAFVVLEGELTLFVGERVLKARPGVPALAPRGIPHVYRVDSEQARWLAIVTPPGFDRFVAELGEPAAEPALPPTAEPDPARVAEVAESYEIEILAPPGTLPS